MNDVTKAPENEPEKTEVTDDNDLRVQSHPDTPLPVQKKKSKKKLLLLIILILVVIGIVASAIVYFVLPKSTSNVGKDDTGVASATKFESAKVLVSDASTRLSGQVIEVTESTGFGGKTADGFGAYSVPPYKVADRKYANLPGSSSGSSYKGSSVDASKNYKALTDFFKKNKFKTVSSGTNTSGINQWFTQELQYITYATYESSNILCTVWHVDATPTAIKNHVTSVGCADKSSYEAAAKELDQFYAAYTKNDNSGAEHVVLGMPTGSDGADNYYNVTLYQEDPDQLDHQFQGLYYRTKDQKEWTYFTGAYGLLSCSEYNTDVLKKAFKDFNCWNDATKSYSSVM